MRPRVEWMTRADDYILEFLNEKTIVATPRVISANIDYSHQYVNERMKPLREHGLVSTTGDGLYEITEKGRAYLAGDLDEEDLHEDN